MDLIEKYKNLTVAQKIYSSKRLPDSLPTRLEHCRRTKNNFSSFVTIRKNQDGKSTYRDVQTCGSVWSCPVCASIISERRCVEVFNSMKRWYAMGEKEGKEHAVLMVNYTTPHHAFESLDSVLSVQDKAVRLLKKRFGFHKIIDSIGSYTARETTFGFLNWWHPHRHELLFIPHVLSKDELLELLNKLSDAFVKSFEAAGGVIDNLYSFKKRSITIAQATNFEDFEKVAKYITVDMHGVKRDGVLEMESGNWPIHREITKGICKKGKNGNFTPFGMLDMIRNNDKNSYFLKERFYEFSETMRKGRKRQLFASKGLKKLLAIDDVSDEEILETCENEHSELFAVIPDKVWFLILALNLRAEVLILSEKYNNVSEFFEELHNIINGFAGSDSLRSPPLVENRELMAA